MAIGTQINTENTSNFEFLDGINLKKSQLNIVVQVGLLSIKSRAQFVASYVDNFANNPFTPAPGGKENESFVNQKLLENNKSSTLSSSSVGVSNQHIVCSGAPYSTFIEGTLLPEKHPYYNLIAGPSDAPVFEANSTLQYNEAQPQIFSQQYPKNKSQESIIFNKLGNVFIPSTTLTSNLVAAAQPQTLLSYNIWKIDNIPIDRGLGISSSYFDFQQYLGFVPKDGAPIDRVQPYAQTVSFSDTAAIQVFSSNAQVSLTRYYPIAKDYAHLPQTEFLIYDSATQETPSLRKVPVGLYEKNAPAVGFVINLKSVILNNSQPTGAEGVVDVPQILISWGNVDFQPQQKRQSDKTQVINKYTLKLSANDVPKVYFDVSSSEIINNTITANAKVVSVPNLKNLNFVDRNSGSKTQNDLSIYVYYIGPFMLIGNSSNPSEWATIAAPKLNPQNAKSSNGEDTITYKHQLNEESKVRIEAQFVNFIYTYGPPLFSPYDANNIKQFTKELPNALNYISGKVPASEQELDVPDLLLKNSVKTFQSAEENQETFAQKNKNNPNAGEFIPMIYVDARAVIKKENFQYYVAKQSVSQNPYKATFPENLGGLTFSKFMPVNAPEPKISDSYVNYNIKLKSGANITEILSNAVASLRIAKKIDGSSLSYVDSDLDISFVNLNKTEDGLKVLQFLRQNIVCIRVWSGYDTVKVFFEGMINSVEVSEGLDKTRINVKAKDLLYHLFEKDETMILSTIQMRFPGMRYKNVINQLVYFSELYNHFQYDLGDPEDNQTIAYQLKYNKLYTLPKIDTSFLNISSLGALQVVPYSTKDNYFSVLKTIKNLSINISTKPGQNIRFDMPIFYWYASVPGLDGIKMSSRTLPKDKDIFYITSRNISEKMINDISELHGFLRTNDGFESSSESTNLFRKGFYRFIDNQGKMNVVDTFNQGDLAASEVLIKNGTINIDGLESYVGYEKIVMFDNPPADFSEVQQRPSLLPQNQYAQFWVDRTFQAGFTNVFEQITLKAYVTEPLKEWGSFQVAYENENVFSLMPDLYLYNSVNYEFNINENLIEVVVGASKKPIQAL